MFISVYCQKLTHEVWITEKFSLNYQQYGGVQKHMVATTFIHQYA